MALPGKQNPSYRHGGSRTRLYGIWKAMKTRCYRKSNKAYSQYGGRGIRICPEWKDDFGAFRNWALKSGYQDGLSIDRYPDNDGPYSPDNCRWATMTQQRWSQRGKLGTMLGRHHTFATRRKMSLAKQGRKNSSYGLVWIRNDELKLSQLISRDCLTLRLRDGWVLGRRFYS